MSLSSRNVELSDRGHDKFVELCAVYTSGSLDAAEQVELREHLAGCKECKNLLADYRRLVQDTIPLLSDDSSLEEANGFDEELADTKSRLFASLKGGEAHRHGEATPRWRGPWNGRRLVPGPAMIYAALVLLMASLSLGGYVLGLKKSARLAWVPNSQDQTQDLRLQLSNAVRQHDSLRQTIEQRDQQLRSASAEIDRQKKEAARLQQVLDDTAVSQSQASATTVSLDTENGSLKAERDGMSRRLDETQSSLLNAQQQLDQLEAERVALQVESATRQGRIEELNAQISEQQRLLAADRDIRDLMGARDLLISDVIDIDTKGRDKKPFGRIFYTKNKSLVFYAFDLDKQPGFRTAATFQAWGARATSHGNENPVNLGIFYMDSANARRWALKSDDPKVLERIDSVFVTIEPEGGSHKPSGRQLLFTYLRGESNHP
jgi:hypothetical protein